MLKEWKKFLTRTSSTTNVLLMMQWYVPRFETTLACIIRYNVRSSHCLKPHSTVPLLKRGGEVDTTALLLFLKSPIFAPPFLIFLMIRVYANN